VTFLSCCFFLVTQGHEWATVTSGLLLQHLAPQGDR